MVNKIETKHKRRNTKKRRSNEVRGICEKRSMKKKKKKKKKKKESMFCVTVVECCEYIKENVGI